MFHWGGGPQLENRLSGDLFGFTVKSGTGLQAGVRTPMQALDAAGSNLQLINSDSQDLETRFRSDARDGKSGTENNEDYGLGNTNSRSQKDTVSRDNSNKGVGSIMSGRNEDIKHNNGEEREGVRERGREDEDDEEFDMSRADMIMDWEEQDIPMMVPKIKTEKGWMIRAVEFWRQTRQRGLIGNEGLNNEGALEWRMIKRKI